MATPLTPGTPGTPGEFDRTYGSVIVLFGDGGGRYPDGNAMQFCGADRTFLVDPSLTVHRRGHDLPAPVDTVLLSHVHEDHIPGLHHFTDRPVLVHEEDRPALDGMAGLLAAYGDYGEFTEAWEQELRRDFHVSFRSDATTYTDGATWDLGGGVTVTAVHLPGHTSGHCGFMVEPDGFFYAADIELTGFGPYYGDATSDLLRFEASLERCRQIEARWYGTFHHKGVIEGADAFRRELDAFASVIRRREDEILAFLAEPHTIDEMAAHRFLYRPNVTLPFVFYVERHSARLHVDKLRRQGRVAEVEPGRFRTVA